MSGSLVLFLSSAYAATESVNAAGPALAHDGYSSVYTIDAANGHLQETYLPALGKPWITQDLSANYGTPPVLQGTEPVALSHGGYTSVYTVDAANGHLQETSLPSIGKPWTTQDLTAKYGTPRTISTPTAVYHSGYTSVYTVDVDGGHLQETYLIAIGDPWITQDLSAKYATPNIASSASPKAVVHNGYTSVYTIDASNGHLQETYLPAIGSAWITQDLSAKYGTPPSATSPAPVVHDGYTSVYTVNASNGHLQETYLSATGSPWTTQDLSTKYGTPAVATGAVPVALDHTGYVSVYTVDGVNDHLQETYLPAIGGVWASQDLSAKYGTPVTGLEPSALLHYDTNGALTRTSVFTVDSSNGHLQETYLPAIGSPWTTQDLSTKYGTPPAA